MPHELIQCLLCLLVAPDQSLFCWLLLSVIFLLTFALFLHHWPPDVGFNQVQGTRLMSFSPLAWTENAETIAKPANLRESAPMQASIRKPLAEWKTVWGGIRSSGQQPRGLNLKSGEASGRHVPLCSLHLGLHLSLELCMRPEPGGKRTKNSCRTTSPFADIWLKGIYFPTSLAYSACSIHKSAGKKNLFG